MRHSLDTLKSFAIRWIKYQRRILVEKIDTDAAGDDEISEIILHLPFDDPEGAFEFIQLVLKLTTEPLILGSLSSGVLEDLLAQHGEVYIEKIEALANKDVHFRNLLDGVWGNLISKEVWQRITALQKN